MKEETKNISDDNNNSSNQYHRGKLVMNVDSEERQELVDRLVIHMIRTKKYRTRSDVIYNLLKERLDQLDVEDRKKPMVAATTGINK